MVPRGDRADPGPRLDRLVRPGVRRASQGFKGSTEGPPPRTKSALARWLSASSPDVPLKFEETSVERVERDGSTVITRVDLLVEGLGRFEIETMASSGPMEVVRPGEGLLRLRDGGTPLWLVVPNEAILRPGPSWPTWHITSGTGVAS